MKPKGQTLMVAIVLLSLMLGYGLITVENVMFNRQVSKKQDAKLVAQNLAEAGVHKAIWCLNQSSGTDCGGTYGGSYAGETNVSLDTGTFTTTVSGSGNERQIESIGKTSDGATTKKIIVTATSAPSTTQISFTFASQVGEDGLTMGNGSQVIGDVYSNGPIVCGSATITGNATAADKIPGNGAHDGSLIDGCTVGNDAKAYRIEDANISRDAYFKSINNSTVTGTQYPNSPEPTSVPFPISDQRMQDMKNDAAAGGTITGDYNPSSSPVSLGPKKITGNLILGNNKVLTVTGTLWVQGTITLSNNSILQLSSSYGSNSGTVLSDNKVFIDNGATIKGSGNASSTLMLISLYSGSNAIELKNNGNGTTLYAPNGEITVTNGADVQELVGKKISLSNNAVLTYDSGRATTSYASTTVGGAWIIKKGTWVAF